MSDTKQKSKFDLFPLEYDLEYPYDVSFIPFVQSSVSCNDDIYSNHEDPFMCIFGGTRENQTLLVELKCNIQDKNDKIDPITNNNINTKEIEFIKHEKIDTSDIGMNKGEYVRSLLIKNDTKYGKCIIVIVFTARYNVYLMNENKWLFGNENKEMAGLYEMGWMGSFRTLFFDNHLLIISRKEWLFFYDLTNFDKEMKLIKKYDIGDEYQYHGMECIEKNKNNIKIVLIGGYDSGPFFQSFLQCDINIAATRENSKNSTNGYEITIEQKQLELNLDNVKNELDCDTFTNFQMQTLNMLNMKNERIIAIIGGINDSQSLMLFNYDKMSVTRYKDILPRWNFTWACSACIHKNHCHVIIHKGHLLMDLANNKIDQFQIHYSQIQWKCERVIWIGFHKNINNNNKCFVANLPKDIIYHILSFLRT